MVTKGVDVGVHNQTDDDFITDDDVQTDKQSNADFKLITKHLIKLIAGQTDDQMPGVISRLMTPLMLQLGDAQVTHSLLASSPPRVAWSV